MRVAFAVIIGVLAFGAVADARTLSNLKGGEAVAAVAEAGKVKPLKVKGEAVAAVSEAGMVKTKKTKAIGGEAVAGVAEAGLKAKTAGKKAGGEGEW